MQQLEKREQLNLDNKSIILYPTARESSELTLTDKLIYGILRNPQRSKKGIAELIGCSRETVRKSLTVLAKFGLIKREDNHLVAIPDSRHFYMKANGGVAYVHHLIGTDKNPLTKNERLVYSYLLHLAKPVAGRWAFRNSYLGLSKLIKMDRATIKKCCQRLEQHKLIDIFPQERSQWFELLPVGSDVATWWRSNPTKELPPAKTKLENKPNSTCARPPAEDKIEVLETKPNQERKPMNQIEKCDSEKRHKQMKEIIGGHFHGPDILDYGFQYMKMDWQAFLEVMTTNKEDRNLFFTLKDWAKENKEKLKIDPEKNYQWCYSQLPKSYSETDKKEIADLVIRKYQMDTNPQIPPLAEMVCEAEQMHQKYEAKNEATYRNSMHCLRSVIKDRTAFYQPEMHSLCDLP